MTNISIRNVAKVYDDVPVIAGLNLEISDTEFVVLVGPSGCGKTTTLRMISGLEAVSDGEIWFGNRNVTKTRPGLRNTSMVFQNYALYPHMTIAENIGYGMKVRGVNKETIAQEVHKAASVLNLVNFLDRRPKHLSGGQRQRVAIGRAIVRDPDIFLFDEPLSNLDAKLRVEMRTEIKSLHRRLKTTIVYVTHDQVEAMTMADRVVVMNNGVIEQASDPITLYEKPANLFVAGFIGAPSMNFMEGEIETSDSGHSFRGKDGLQLTLPDNPSSHYTNAIGKPVVLGLRPENVTARDAGNPSVKLIVKSIEPLGPHTLLIGTVAGENFTAQVPTDTTARPDDIVPIPLDLSKAHFFDNTSGLALT
ncbi:MAG: sn-glycerol-3-phosphate ABC transporter ATP-binding protein UgpC [Granulosicoccus sp.]